MDRKLSEMWSEKGQNKSSFSESRIKNLIFIDYGFLFNNCFGDEKK